MSGSDARLVASANRHSRLAHRMALLMAQPTLWSVTTALLFLLPAQLGAQPASGEMPEITEADIARAVQRHRLPPSLLTDQPPTASTLRIDGLPQPMQPAGPLDLAALARGFDAAVARTPGQGLDSGPRLLVFVSFSMPDRTWQRLLQQAERAQATLILRGLVDGSLRQTVLRMQQLIGQRKVAVQIDPQAFDHHAVTVVPTIVLLRADGADTAPCTTGYCVRAQHGGSTQSNTSHWKAAGDVSLDYALRQLVAAAPSAAADARVFLQRLLGDGR